MLCPDEPENQCVANGVTYQEGMSMQLLLHFYTHNILENGTNIPNINIHQTYLGL